MGDKDKSLFLAAHQEKSPFTPADLEAYRMAANRPFLTNGDLIAVLKTLPLDAPAFLKIPGSTFTGPFRLDAMTVYQRKRQCFFGLCLGKGVL
jgi:hypothetical protein